MSRNRSHAVILAAVAALAVLGCGGDNLGTERRVAAVSVTPTTSTITPGGTVQLEAATKDADGATLTGREITWSSSDNATATVSATGLATGVADGSATITATSEGQSGSAVITVATPTAPSFTAVSAGYVHTCGVAAGGAAYCWGYNGAGQLGIGTSEGPEYCGEPDPHLSTACSTVPLPVTGGISFAALSAGEGHTCGLTTDGLAYCWGANDFGQLGSGSTVNTSSVPIAVTGGLRSQVIAAGVASSEGHSCGLTTAGAAYCWGGNEFGQLGDGSNSDKTTHAPVTGEFAFSAVVGGAWHTCGVTTSGVAYCWGANGHGQLGDGSNTYVSAPVAVAGGLMFSIVTAGAVHNCGVTQGGMAYCWGESEHGELGNGSTAASAVPTAVLGGLSFTTVAAGTFHTCGISSGAVYCWGLNGNGQLGDATTNSSAVPVRVAELP